MTRFLRAVLFAAFTVVMLAPVSARASCVSPGDLLDVPTPGFLKSDPANLFLRVAESYSPVTLISQTNSRLRFLLPVAGSPWGQPFKIVHVEAERPDKVVSTGMLCDDPSGGGSTGGGSGSGGSGSGGSGSGSGSGGSGSGGSGSGGGATTDPETTEFAVRGVRQQRVFRATRNDVAAPSGEPEVVLVGKQSEISEAQVLLSRAGVAILRNESLRSLGIAITAVDLRGRLSLDELRALLAQQRISVSADRHSVYGAAAGLSYAGPLVGVEPGEVCRVPSGIRIGIIDGPVDQANPALQGVPMLVDSVLGPRERTGSSDHATGIAALIAGQTTAQTPAGLAPGAQLFSVVAFARNGGRDVATLENIAKALDRMIERKVSVVNMSLAGPHNDALEDVIRVADQRGLILVAATGNNRRDRVAYPAADPRVIAITAVDIRKRKYAKANSGVEVDFAAPGVDILTPRRRGTTLQSGTSFAAAIATGIIAQELSGRRMTREQLIARLRQRAEDLGAPGRDEIYGWGLVKAQGC